MAKAVRGLPSGFTLDLPDDDKPVTIGDYLDEPAPAMRTTPRVLPTPGPSEEFRSEPRYDFDREYRPAAHSGQTAPERRPAPAQR
jgi:hypothetical protein